MGQEHTMTTEGPAQPRTAPAVCWSADGETVFTARIRCHVCRSPHCTTYRTTKTPGSAVVIRHRLCKACGHKFREVEQ